MQQGTNTLVDDPLLRSCRVVPLTSALKGEMLYRMYLTLAAELGLGDPSNDHRQKGLTTFCCHAGGWRWYGAERKAFVVSV